MNNRVKKTTTCPEVVYKEPVILPRSAHNISRRAIHPLALKVLYRLQEAGFSAYLVGGCVRDILLNLAPKDFDVATNAHPEQVRALFSNSRLIGRRFRIVHVFFGRQIVEVTTFRRAVPESIEEADVTGHLSQNELAGILQSDNSYGTIEEDAIRRDFTANALYYNIADFSVVDYTGGIEDLGKRVLRLIGDPAVRFREDPVRMLRGLRLAGKLGFQLDQAIEQALPHMNALLHHVPRLRLFDELIKITTSGQVTCIFELLLHYEILPQLMPSVTLAWEKDKTAEALAKAALVNTDNRVACEKSINPAFMLAVLYWPIMCAKQQALEQTPISKGLAFDQAGFFAAARAAQELNIPKRFIATMRDIWYLQRRFNGPKTKRLLSILALAKFRAGYDFLLLRADIQPELQPLADFWTKFYEASSEEERLALIPAKPNCSVA